MTNGTIPKIEKWMLIQLTAPTIIGVVKNHAKIYDGFTVQLEFLDLDPAKRILYTRYRCFDEKTQSYFTKYDQFELGEPDRVWASTKRFY